jgi:catechol-2,3-dioxygenase
MKRTMHLYETHLPVKDTEVSSRFYVDVVGLEYAHRDLTRDVVFLWIGSKKRSMLGLWVPPRLGANLIVVTLLSL